MADENKSKRRDFIFTASYALGAVGVGATVWPLIDQMNPDASVKALASTEVDISSIDRGQSITVLWRGKPVFIRRRTEEEIAKAKEVNLKELKHPEKDEDRAKDPNLTREFLFSKGVTQFKLIDSLGATEAYPFTGSSEIITDITSTGETLKANNLRILKDGEILRSEACMMISKSSNNKMGLRKIVKLLSKN